jgi:hypothetical protein
MIVTSAGGRIVPADPVKGPAFAVIEPHAVALYNPAPSGSPRRGRPTGCGCARW